MEESIDRLGDFESGSAPRDGERGSMNRHAQVWGFYLGGLKSVLLLIMVLTLMVEAPFWFSVLDFTIIIGMISSCVRVYKRAGSTPLMTYSKVLKLGTLQSLYASIVIFFMAALAFYVIKPSYVDVAQEQSLQVLADTFGEDSVMYNNMVQTMERMNIPLLYTMSMVFNMFLSGFIFTLFVGVFTKEKKG